MRNISHPEGIYRCNAQDYIWKLRSSDSSRTKRQVNAFILCRDTFIPLTFSPILAQESRLKRLQMPRHGVSECSIGCKGNEKNDYSRIFSWLFFVGRIKTDVWAHKRRLIAPKHTILLVFLLEFQISFSKCFVDSCNKFLWLEIFHLRKGKPFLT